MPLLRLTHFADGPDQHRVEISLEGDGARRTAVSRFEFALSDQDQEDLRWYLEDFLQYPLDPAPTIAARIEARMAQIGSELFNAIFQSNDDARDLWATARAKLNNRRVEIATGVREATTIPWELIRDPKTDTPLALRAQAFVRASHQTAQPPRLPLLLRRLPLAGPRNAPHRGSRIPPQHQLPVLIRLGEIGSLDWHTTDWISSESFQARE